MKKIMAFVLLCFIFVLIGNMNTFASQYNELPVGKNYLSLSNLRPLSDQPYYVETIEPIRVKLDTRYTLIFDYEFLGSVLYNLSEAYVLVEDYEDIQYHINYLIGDEYNQLAYFEFTTESEWIHIRAMPNGFQEEHNVMLYEGYYADFEGFQPYINPSEVMNYQGFIPMDYDNLLTIDQIQSYIKVRNSLGNLMAYDVVSDTFSESSKLPGLYQMMFQVTHNLITKKYILDIKIYDITSPLITISEAIEIPLSEKLDIDTIKSKLTVIDNVDNLTTSSLLVLEDTYTQAITVGTYHILFEASDLSGNKSTLEVPITLLDNQGPVIHGPQLIYLYTTDAIITNEQILSKYHAIDDVDGANVNVSMSSNLYNQKVTPGRYLVTLTSSDTSLNITYRSIYIHVIENKGPVFEVNEKIIEKSVAETMSEAEIINWLKAELELSGIAATNVKVLFNEYTSNEKLSGSYFVYLTYDVEEVSQTSRVRIDVTEAENQIPYVLYISLTTSLILIGFGVAYYVKKKKI